MTAKGIATETLGPLLHGAVPAYAATSPDALAVVDATGAMSYAELDEAARCFANELTSRGVRRGARIALDLPPSVELTIAMLSTLRIGATIVPVDQVAPARWRAQVVAQSEAAAVVGRGLIVEWHSNECVDPKQPALLLYRARGGTPAEPVALTHALVAARLDFRQAAWPITPDDRVLWHSSPRSHVWPWECFGTLRTGATLIASPAREPAGLRNAVREHAVTVAHFGASRLGGLLADSSHDDLVALRRVHCEGDPLPSATMDALRSRSAAQIVHGFGTLAAGGLLLAWECDANDPRVPPEGTPLGDVSVKIVDALGAPVPRGVVGEVRVDGRPVGRCGIVRADGAVQLRPETTGDIEINGCDISLHALAEQLLAHGGVADCAVVALDLAGGERRLAAYVQPSASPRASDSASECAWIAEWRRAFDANTAPRPRVRSSATRADDIRRFAPRHVFEIGCGSGDLAVALGSECDEYVACDFSRATAERAAVAVDARDLTSVRVEQRDADDFRGLDPASFDVVVIDDVCAYFPSVAYLDRVVRGCLEITRAGGAVVIGSVLDLAHHPEPSDERLWVARDYFTALVRTSGCIQDAEIRANVGTGTYDVILHVGEATRGTLDVARGPDAIGPGLTNDPLARITTARRESRLTRELEAMLAPHLRGVPARIDVIAVDHIPRVHSGTLASEAR